MVERFHIDEAGRHIAAHPAVEGRQQLDGPHSDGGYIWSFDMRVGRPACGYQNGVLERERVRLYFPSTYPFKAPRIFLRQDFCRALPHINPSWDVDPLLVEPCVINEQPDTFVRWNGLTAYLDRLVAWLDDAAHDTLRSRDGKWEPMRRDGWMFRLLAPVNRLREMMLFKARHEYLWARITARRETWSHAVVPHDNPKPLQEVIAVSKTDRAIVPVIFAWGGDEAIHGHIRPDVVMRLRDVVQIGGDFGCVTLTSALQNLAQVAGSAGLDDLSFIIIIAVRRPLPLVGTHPVSNVELLPYAVAGRIATLSVGKRSYILDHDSRVDPMPLHNMPTLEMASTLSGVVYPARATAALIGCGSLGSKVAMYLGKSGFGKLVLLDSDVLLPHNLFRMGIVADPEFSGFSKVHAVAYDLGCLGIDSEARLENVVGSLTADGTLAFPADTILAIDTTASPNVHDALCHHVEGAEPARLAQAAFLAGGRLGYFRMEGEGRSPDLEDLETAMWRLWMLDPPDVDASQGLTAIDVGQGCTSATMVMSDMAASLLAAGIARQASDLLAGDLPAVGRLSTAVVGTDGASVRWAHLDQAPSIQVPCNDGWSIHLLPQLHDEITTQAREAGANETGGYLLARVNWVLRRITIAAQFPAPPDSICTPTLFVLGIEGAKDGLDDMVVRSMNGLIPIGTWHSHPRGGGVSQTDLKTLRDIARDFIRLPALGLIWRPDGYTAMVKEGA